MLHSKVIQTAIEEFFNEQLLEKKPVDGAVRYTVERGMNTEGGQPLRGLCLKLRVINERSSVFIDQKMVTDAGQSSTVHESEFSGITGVSVGDDALNGKYLELTSSKGDGKSQRLRLYKNCSISF